MIATIKLIITGDQQINTKVGSNAMNGIHGSNTKREVVESPLQSTEIDAKDDVGRERLTEYRNVPSKNKINQKQKPDLEEGQRKGKINHLPNTKDNIDKAKCQQNFVRTSKISTEAGCQILDNKTERNKFRNQNVLPSKEGTNPLDDNKGQSNKHVTHTRDTGKDNQCQTNTSEHDCIASATAKETVQQTNTQSVKRKTSDQCLITNNESNQRQKTSGQQQKQTQLLRSKQASQQMLYGVYGNVISILEELEKRKTKRELPRSDIFIPDQSRKTDSDVKAIVEAQLLVFEAQSIACPCKVKESVNDELRKKTIEWMAVREEQKADDQEIDKLVCKLYEILTTGQTTHEFLRKSGPHITEEGMQVTMQHIMKGKNDAHVLDKSFKDNREKKAEAPNTREHSDLNILKLVEKRLLRHNKTLEHYLRSDINQMEQSLR